MDERNSKYYLLDKVKMKVIKWKSLRAVVDDGSVWTQ
jgi:hypothetical protein